MIGFCDDDKEEDDGEKYQRSIPRTTNFPPPIQNQLCKFLEMTHLNKLTSQFDMKCTLEGELRFKRVHYCIRFGQKYHGIALKRADQAQSCD